jgi:hypothetical protein
MERVKKKDIPALTKNKRIPEKYAESILEALTHYPELYNVRIDFKLRKTGKVPYGTKPSMLTLFRSPAKRKYIISLLEDANGPMEMALFKNLSHSAKLGVLGHELNHVVQFKSRSTKELLKLLVSYTIPYFKKRIERNADIATIEHGLGRELYVHAVYIRCIPGYTEERKDINKYYLKPQEIFRMLKNGIGKLKTEELS